MRLLLVEDEEALAEALATALKKENYSVDIAYDGGYGLDCALSDIYDVIVLDIMLPVMDGIEVLKNLRSSNISTPVIMLTAKTELDAKLLSFDYGADDYLTKPFLTQELVARIRAVTRRKGEIQSSIITCGNLSLDTKVCEISCEETGQKMQLSSKEFQMLEYFMNNPRQVISKEQFIDKVWGYDSNAEYNSVEVYISFLRKKLQFIGSNAKIRAVRGVGYLIEEEK